MTVFRRIDLDALNVWLAHYSYVGGVRPLPDEHDIAAAVRAHDIAAVDAATQPALTERTNVQRWLAHLDSLPASPHAPLEQLHAPPEGTAEEEDLLLHAPASRPPSRTATQHDYSLTGSFFAPSTGVVALARTLAPNVRDTGLGTTTSTTEETKSGKDLPDVQQRRLLKDRAANWSRFYKINTKNFFKDRHYLGKEYGCYLERFFAEGADHPVVFCELGCGVGNAVLPLLAEYPTARMLAIDQSDVAIKILDAELEKLTPEVVFANSSIQRPSREVRGNTSDCETTPVEKNVLRSAAPWSPASVLNFTPSTVSSSEDTTTPAKEDFETTDEKRESENHVDDEDATQLATIPFARNRTRTLVADATNLQFRKLTTAFTGRVDVVFLLFCLSAIPPALHAAVAANARALLKKNGLLIIRDYCRGDWAEQRFAAERHKPARMGVDHLFARSDGTLSYFFGEHEWEERVFVEGWEKLEVGVVGREIVNRASEKTMQRKWLQGVFKRM